MNFKARRSWRRLGITPRTIRFYEARGLIAPRRAGNMRVYAARDRARMKLILRGKKVGFTLRGIKEFLDLYDADPLREKQNRFLLKGVRGANPAFEGSARGLGAGVGWALRLGGGGLSRATKRRLAT